LYQGFYEKRSSVFFSSHEFFSLFFLTGIRKRFFVSSSIFSESSIYLFRPILVMIPSHGKKYMMEMVISVTLEISKDG